MRYQNQEQRRRTRDTEAKKNVDGTVSQCHEASLHFLHSLVADQERVGDIRLTDHTTFQNSFGMGPCKDKFLGASASCRGVNDGVYLKFDLLA